MLNTSASPASGVVLLLAVALLCWPDLGAARRLRGAATGARRPQPSWSGTVRYASVPTAAVVGAVVAGVGGACSASLIALLARKYWQARRDFRSRLSQSTQLAAGLRVLVAELRAGSHPAAAAEGVAADAGPAVAGLFGDIAVVARLGGDVPATLLESGRVSARLHDPVGRLARCWGLAERHGVALADLLDAVRRDLDSRTAFARDVESKMAGPRSTAGVLAGLPLLGLLLGESVGAGPVEVLTGGLLGQVLLVVGTCLICSGVLWTVRLTESAVRP